MKASNFINEHTQYITGKGGKTEYVVLPINDFQKLIALVEEYGLGQAMKKTSKDKFYTKKQAQKLLENN